MSHLQIKKVFALAQVAEAEPFPHHSEFPVFISTIYYPSIFLTSFLSRKSFLLAWNKLLFF